MRRFILVVFLLAACNRTEAPERAAAPPPPPKAPSAPAPLAQPADPLAERYAALQQLIDSWSGDGAILQKARAEAMALLEQNRDYAPAYVALARIEFREGYLNGNNYEPAKLDRAAKLARHALKLDPNNAEAQLAAGNVAAYGGDFDIASEHFAAAERLQPNDPRLALARIDMAEMQDDVEGAIRIGRASAALMKEPTDLARFHTSMASNYETLSMMDEADAAHRAAIAAEPKAAWLHGNYSAFLNRRRHFDAAIREGETAMRLMPYGMGMSTLINAYLGRAEELFRDNDLAGAGAMLERLQSLDKADPDANAAIGRYYLLAATRQPNGGFLEKAESAFRAALKVDPDHEEAKKGMNSIEARRK